MWVTGARTWRRHRATRTRAGTTSWASSVTETRSSSRFSTGTSTGPGSVAAPARRRSGARASEYYDPRAVCRLLGRRRGVTTAVDGGRVRRSDSRPASSAPLASRPGAPHLEHRWTRGDRISSRPGSPVQHGATVDAYDATTGAKRGLARAAHGRRDASASCSGVQGSLAVYETGGAIHLLRLSDGRGQGSAPSRRRACARRQPRAGRPLRELEQDVRPPAGPARVHPARRSPARQGGRAGNCAARARSKQIPSSAQVPSMDRASAHAQTRGAEKDTRTGGNDVQASPRSRTLFFSFSASRPQRPRSWSERVSSAARALRRIEPSPRRAAGRGAHRRRAGADRSRSHHGLDRYRDDRHGHEPRVGRDVHPLD